VAPLKGLCENRHWLLYLAPQTNVQNLVKGSEDKLKALRNANRKHELKIEGEVAPPDLLRYMLQTMIRIRLFEERVRDDFLARMIPGMAHSYIGEEAIATGVCSALDPNDYIASTHRGHGHAIAKGVGLDVLLAELYGKATGVCAGRGGSMHVADFGLGMLGCNGIVGGGFGLAVGAALSAVQRKSGQVAVCFFGDGAINKGTFHEAMNFAAVSKLPVVFICENNRFAQYTAFERLTSVRDLSVRSKAYGIPGETIDGNDVLAVYSTTKKAVERARGHEGPTLVNAETYRFLGHHMGDAEAYRSKDDVAERRKADPILRFEAWMKGRGFLTDQARQQMWDQSTEEVASAAIFAAQSPDPDPATALDDLFTPTAGEFDARGKD
jgi:acetoin:2,6-dichlorophenolindophenol oxidoreductase subunit alpha